MKSHILLYEPNINYLPSLVLLLSVGGIAATHARSAAEALNWLKAIRLRVVAFDLVLIGSWIGAAAEDELVKNVLALPLPLVFLQRDASQALVELPHGETIVCDDDNLLSCLNACLTLKQGEAYDRRANTSC